MWLFAYFLASVYTFLYINFHGIYPKVKKCFCENSRKISSRLWLSAVNFYGIYNLPWFLLQKHEFKMAMSCEGCSNAAKRVLAKIGGMNNECMMSLFKVFWNLLYLLFQLCVQSDLLFGGFNVIVSRWKVVVMVLTLKGESCVKWYFFPWYLTWNFSHHLVYWILWGLKSKNSAAVTSTNGGKLQLTRSRLIFQLRSCLLRLTSLTTSCLLLWRKLARMSNMSD